MSIALIAVDLDGTLLTSAGVLAPQGARVLRLAAVRGIHVVLATTRLPATTGAFCRQIGITGPMVCTNGAETWASPDGPLWSCHCIPQDAARAIARLADALGWELSTTVGATTYWRQRPGQPLGVFRPGIAIVPSNLDGIAGDPVRILASRRPAIEAIGDLCRTALASQCRADVYYDRDGVPHSIGVFAPGADKGTALRDVLARLSIPPEQAMAIGDNPNDLPMFAQVGVSVAMGNAPQAVRDRATCVAPSNDQEGVAWAVRALALSPPPACDENMATQ